MPDTPNKHEFLDKILKLAAEKPEFKEQLLQNPKETIQAMVSFPLPEEFEVAVHEDTPSKLNIILPDSSDELSEVELSAVSGGSSWWEGTSSGTNYGSGCG